MAWQWSRLSSWWWRIFWMRTIIGAIDPVIIPIWLESSHECIHWYFHHIITVIIGQKKNGRRKIKTLGFGFRSWCEIKRRYVLAAALHGSFAIFYPSWHCEIRRLGTIESMIESSMVAERERDHKFICFLCYLKSTTNNNKSRDEIKWRKKKTYKTPAQLTNQRNMYALFTLSNGILCCLSICGLIKVILCRR